MTRWQYTDPETVLQERAEYTLERVAEAIWEALVAGEADLELQTLQLVGEAGDRGFEVLINAADRGLRSCSWKPMRPRSPAVTVRRDLIGTAEDGELQIRIYLTRRGVLNLSLQRKIGWGPIQILRDIEIPMDTSLWEQVREAQ